MSSLVRMHFGSHVYGTNVPTSELSEGKNAARRVLADCEEAVEITLSKGKTCLIDLGDWEAVRRYRWAATVRSHTSYALAQVRKPDGTETKLYMHILLARYPKGEKVDHRNHNGLDNRQRNFRPSGRKGNQANTRSRRGSSSAFKGVSWDKSRNKWIATIKCDDRSKTLGRFDDEFAAARVYDAKAVELHGEFACLNFP